jgi:glycosyltransferase involved in cell wall biosynthesis
MPPLVTTIIPTYNRAALVCEAIESVRRQTYPNLEIVVVDDGSSDGTASALAAYGDAIRVIKQNNSGPSAARNRGIAAAKGVFVAFLDSDDVWHPSKLARQIDLLQRAGPSVHCCLSNALVERPGGISGTTTFEHAGLVPACQEGIWSNVTEILSTRFVMFTQMVAIRRAALERVGGFDEGLWFMEDYDLALRLSLEGPWAFIAEPLVTYRQESPDSLAAAGCADRLRLIESSLQARRNLYDRVSARGGQAHLTRLSRRALRAFERERFGIRLSARPERLKSIIGRGVLGVNRLQRALHRRSPWYPAMRVTSLAAPALTREARGPSRPGRKVL